MKELTSYPGSSPSRICCFYRNIFAANGGTNSKLLRLDPFLSRRWFPNDWDSENKKSPMFKSCVCMHWLRDKFASDQLSLHQCSTIPIMSGYDNLVYVFKSLREFIKRHPDIFRELNDEWKKSSHFRQGTSDKMFSSDRRRFFFSIFHEISSNMNNKYSDSVKSEKIKQIVIPLFQEYKGTKDSDENIWCSQARKAALEMLYNSLRLSFSDQSNTFDALRFLNRVREGTFKCTDFPSFTRSHSYIAEKNPPNEMIFSETCITPLLESENCMQNYNMGCKEFFKHRQCYNKLTKQCFDALAPQCQAVFDTGCRKCLNDYYALKYPLSIRGIHVDEYLLPHTCTAETLYTLDATLFALRVWYTPRPSLFDYGLRLRETRTLAPHLIPDRTRAGIENFFWSKCKHHRTEYDSNICIQHLRS